jgi:uncharacterized oxidoreductase
MDIRGNTVLVTGGATGIGFALAEAFLSEGNRVIICGRRQEKLDEAKARHPGLITRLCDVTDELDRQELLHWAEREFPEMNVLVNNAGIQRDIDFTAGIADLVSGESEIGVNLEAPVYLSAMFIPFLRGKPGASIVNVTSGLAFRPTPSMPLYCATKVALHMFSITMRQQLEPLGIRVFEAIPPFIADTELNLVGRARRFRGQPAMPSPTPAEYASSVIKGMGADTYEMRY